MTRYKKTMAEAIAEVWANDIQLEDFMPAYNNLAKRYTARRR